MLNQPPMCGSYEPFLQHYKRKFDPQRGYVYFYSYKGLSELQAEALQQSWVESGCACDLQSGHGTSLLEVEDSTQQYTMDTWEVVANEIHIDGLSHPTVLASTSDSQIRAMRSGLDSSPIKDPATITSIATVPTLIRFYGLQTRGSTEYRRGQYVLRHRTNAPNRWGANISDIGVDQIYTIGQLLSEVQNSNSWTFPLPARLVYKISRISADYNPGPQPFYQWGWLKNGSTETTAANNRVDITTEYTLELWSTDYYAIR